MSLTEKWLEGTLSREDVKAWALKEPETRDLTDKELVTLLAVSIKSTWGITRRLL